MSSWAVLGGFRARPTRNIGTNGGETESSFTVQNDFVAAGSPDIPPCNDDGAVLPVTYPDRHAFGHRSALDDVGSLAPRARLRPPLVVASDDGLLPRRLASTTWQRESLRLRGCTRRRASRRLHMVGIPSTAVGTRRPAAGGRSPFPPYTRGRVADAASLRDFFSAHRSS